MPRVARPDLSGGRHPPIPGAGVRDRTATQSGRVWKVGTTEPANRQTTKTDTEPTLQTAGAFGLQEYASISVTNTPIVASFENLNAVPAAWRSFPGVTPP